MAQRTNWHPVGGQVGFYEVSDSGLVRNVVTGKVLTPMWTGQKRKQYATVDMRGTIRKVHHLVLEAFVGPRPQGYLGCHKDDDTSNNTLKNLEWATPTDNIHQAYKNNGTLLLTEEQCREIVLRRNTGETGASLAREFHVSQQTICDLVKGRRRTYKGDLK